MNMLTRMLGLVSVMFIAMNASAAVVQANGTLYDYDADGDLLIDDMKMGQVGFEVFASGDVVIDLTTDLEFDGKIFLFNMAGPTLVSENDDESYFTFDSYLLLNLDPGIYMVAVGTTYNTQQEALLGYSENYTFALNSFASSTAVEGDWGITIIGDGVVSQAVPVPPAMMMFASSLFGLVCVARRRN